MAEGGIPLESVPGYFFATKVETKRGWIVMVHQHQVDAHGRHWNVATHSAAARDEEAADAWVGIIGSLGRMHAEKCVELHDAGMLVLALRDEIKRLEKELDDCNSGRF